MAKIQVGDEVYFLKDTLDFRLYQVKVTIVNIKSVPMLNRTRTNLYCGHLSDSGNISSYYYGDGWLKKKRMIRKTPFPDIPILVTTQEIMGFRDKTRRET